MSEKATMNLVLENFDPEAFLGYQYEEALDTTRTLIPAGWHETYIEDFEIVKPRQYVSKQTGEKEWGSPVLKLKCPIEDEGIRAMLGVTDSSRVLYAYPNFYLDLNSEGVLDMGPNKNIALGKLREALGQNEDGMPWSFRDLRGSKKFFAECRHDMPDPKEPERVYERWNNFAAEMEPAA